MELQVIGSSSKGNCYILTAEGQKLIIECGVSYRDIQKAVDFNFSDVVGCIITHEHQDHSKAVPDLINKSIDVYMSKGTKDALRLKSHRLITHRYKGDGFMQFEIGQFIILPFSVQHDCAEPVGYIIQDKKTKEKILFATDTYYIKYKFSGLHYIMIECNHIADLIEDSVIRNRLKESHFSLENVKDFLAANDMASVRKIVLLHLSNNNSDANRMIREITEQTKIETQVATAGKHIDFEMQPF
jgi:phosphoribosyl 1,2-cyclic phosphodiesterase